MLIKITFLMGVLLSSLSARENPFLSQKEAEDIPISNNYIQAPDDFKKEIFILPESARILDSIEIIYMNTDGSIGRKRVEIDKKFDWKRKLAFSYNYNQPTPKKSVDNPVITTTKTITKTIKRRVSKVVNNEVIYDKESEESEESLTDQPVKRDKVKDEIAVTHYINGEPEDETLKREEEALNNINSEGSIFNQSGELQAKERAVQQNSASIYRKSSIWGNSIEDSSSGNSLNQDAEESPTATETETPKDNFKSGKKESRVTVSIGKPKFTEFDFDIEKSEIKISTADKKNRHYMLIRPNRIVIDFQREINFQNQTFEIDKGIFKEMKISKKGSSGYRISIYIEDGYRYKLNRTESGYDIECYKQ